MLPKQWRTALVSLEIAWSSDTLGAGVEWPLVTGRTDTETLELLRAIQRKFVGVVRR